MIKEPHHLQGPPSIDPSWADTGEMPVAPGLATWDQIQRKEKAQKPNWHDGLPKPAYQQDLPIIFKEPLDPEKLAARITWICLGTFALLIMLICMWHVLLAVSGMK